MKIIHAFPRQLRFSAAECGTGSNILVGRLVAHCVEVALSRLLVYCAKMHGVRYPAIDQILIELGAKGGRKLPWPAQ